MGEFNQDVKNLLKGNGNNQVDDTKIYGDVNDEDNLLKTMGKPDSDGLKDTTKKQQVKFEPE
jgi:hypothetical protein